MKFIEILVFGIVVLSIASIFSTALMNLISEEGYLEANIVKVVGTSIVIGNNCTAIIAETSPERAQSIGLGLEKRIEERPNSHDSFVDVLKSFNITLESVSIERYDNKFYYSNMLLRTKEKVLKLDVRPSDAIAIALRANAKIYLNKTLLQEIGKNIC